MIFGARPPVVETPAGTVRPATWHHIASRRKAPDEALGELAGKFIVLDGPDGAGKTTQLAALARRLKAEGRPVVTARDPGGTPLGEGLRELLLAQPHRPEPYCELLLFMASRAQLVTETIQPALARGATVLCDRFIWSTLAYQAANGSTISEILALARGAVGACWPDLTVLLDVPPEIGLARIARTRRAAADAIESRGSEYLHHVRQLYLAMPQRFRLPMVLLDASGTPEDVADQIWDVVTSAVFEASPQSA